MQFVFGKKMKKKNESRNENLFLFKKKKISSTHAVTIVSQYPWRHIQIILRQYKSPAEILMGFDVDCCSVGYDGKNVRF